MSTSLHAARLDWPSKLPSKHIDDLVTAPALANKAPATIGATKAPLLQHLSHSAMQVVKLSNSVCWPQEASTNKAMSQPQQVDRSVSHCKQRLCVGRSKQA